MTAVRSFLDALVERRLWPVALVLVAAIVATPVVLAKKGGDAGQSASPSAGATPTADVPSLTTPGTDVVASVGSGRGLKSLSRRNPFAPHRVHRAASTTGSTSGSGGSTSTSSSSTSGSSGGASSSTSGGASSDSGSATVTPAAPPKKAKKTKKTYLTVSVDLAFGRIGHRRRHRNLARLSALPSAAHPVIIYLGVVRGSKTAVFLLSSDVHAEGDGHCYPSAASCETVHVPLGGTELFDVFSGSGASTQYELDLTHVTFSRTTSRTDATKSFLRAAKGGRAAVKASGAKYGMRYNPKIGRLVPVKKPRTKAKPGATAAPPAARPIAGTPEPPAPPASSLGALRALGVSAAAIP